MGDEADDTEGHALKGNIKKIGLPPSGATGDDEADDTEGNLRRSL